MYKNKNKSNINQLKINEIAKKLNGNHIDIEYKSNRNHIEIKSKFTKMKYNSYRNQIAIHEIKYKSHRNHVEVHEIKKSNRNIRN